MCKNLCFSSVAIAKGAVLKENGEQPVFGLFSAFGGR